MDAGLSSFLKEGASVVAADLQDDKGTRLVEEFGGKVSYVRCDVASEADVKAMIAHAVEKFGRLDCLFNFLVLADRLQIPQ